MPEQETAAARIGVDVRAGLIPGQPMQEFSRSWFLLSADWNDPKKNQAELLAEINGKALGYANLLMLQPDRVNWVKTEWVYF